MQDQKGANGVDFSGTPTVLDLGIVYGTYFHRLFEANNHKGLWLLKRGESQSKVASGPRLGGATKRVAPPLFHRGAKCGFHRQSY